MKKRLSEDLTLYFSPIFPKIFHTSSSAKLAVIGVGGNLGKVQRRFKKVALLFASHPKITLLQTAPVLKNPPFGFLDQPSFFNTLFLIDTKLSPKELLQYCLYVEKRFKRERTFKNAPRTLDLDIIFYDNQKIVTKDLFIPHPFWEKRESVIIPLKYLLRIG